MKKLFAMIMAVTILTTIAMAGDFSPGSKIRFNGNEERWDSTPAKSINNSNYSVSSIKWTQGKDLVSSVTIDDEDEVLVVTLKKDYKSTKDKTLEGTVKLRQKGKTNYNTLSINAEIGYTVVDLAVDANGEISLDDIDKDSIYRVQDDDRGYGTLNFSAGDTDISVRVYDGEVYYLYSNSDAIKSVLTANNDTDSDIDFLTFEGKPSFNATATISFFGVDEDMYIYEVNDNGRLTRSAAKWNEDNDTWELRTRTLGSYVFSDTALKSPAGSSADDKNDRYDEDNPDTGANDITGVASALALTAMFSAAAVSLKKYR